MQDSWQIRPNLLVIYGIRYDYYAAPTPLANAPFVYNQSFRNPGKDCAPRIGLAYTVTPKTVLRVSSGIFFDVPSTNLWYQTYANGGLATAFQGSFTPTTAGAPLFPSFTDNQREPRDTDHLCSRPELPDALHHQFEHPDHSPVEPERRSDGGLRQHAKRAS